MQFLAFYLYDIHFIASVGRNEPVNADLLHYTTQTPKLSLSNSSYHNILVVYLFHQSVARLVSNKAIQERSSISGLIQLLLFFVIQSNYATHHLILTNVHVYLLNVSTQKFLHNLQSGITNEVSEGAQRSVKNGLHCVFCRAVTARRATTGPRGHLTFP